MKNIFIELQKFQSEIDQLKYLTQQYPLSFFNLIKRNEQCKQIKDYVYSKTQSLPENANLSIRSYCVLHNISEIPKCQNCNNTLPLTAFRGFQKGFAQYCNNMCSNCSEKKKHQLQIIFLEKYGTTSPLSNKELREQGKQTKLKRYGNENYVNVEKTKQTCLERYGVDNPAKLDKIKEKTKQTMIERYGVENSMQHPELKKKQLQSSIAHFGKDNINNRKKAIETCKNHTEEQKKDIKQRTIATNIERYGVANPVQSKEIQDKITQTKLQNHGDKNFNNREKAKQTCLEKYGVTSWTKTEMFKQQMKECNNSRMNKQYITKKQRNSFAFSKAELKVYELLKTKFREIKRQYKSEKYPFKCDFYIPEQDLYIEYNGIWTHGMHAYDPTSAEDQLRLEKLICKAKTSAYYKSAIQTWTVTDPLKRKTAKSNKLNFVELWNMTDVKKYIQLLCK